jgi:MFS superfamily sulfate permease-like transporter
MAAASAKTQRLRFDRHELAGAFGDIGTDLPLLVALVATCGLDAASVCIGFGLLQIATGVLYGMPMPVQPLKAMAAIMLAERLSPGTLAGGGLVIGAVMLLLALTGGLDWLARIVPKEVVRGIQLGLGITLASLALGKYAGVNGASGYVLAGVSALLLLALRGRRGLPGSLVVMGLGVVYAAVVHLDHASLASAVGFRLPVFHAPTREELAQGALLLALPQIPLSLGNSVIATSQTTRDLFPERPVPVRKIGLSYGLMNLVAPWFGGVPVCHGCGGLVGFYGFGARTGGAPVIYGSMYLVLGLFFAPGFAQVVQVFPMPVLGVVLLFEAVALMGLVRDVAGDRSALWVALLVAATVVGLPYGYVVGLVVGTLLAWVLGKGRVRAPAVVPAEVAPSPNAEPGEQAP